MTARRCKLTDKKLTIMAPPVSHHDLGFTTALGESRAQSLLRWFQGELRRMNSARTEAGAEPSGLRSAMSSRKGQALMSGDLAPRTLLACQSLIVQLVQTEHRTCESTGGDCNNQNRLDSKERPDRDDFSNHPWEPNPICQSSVSLSVLDRIRGSEVRPPDRLRRSK